MATTAASRVTPDEAVFLLENGARMDQPTFHALYLRTPEGFRAQLIGGTVYVMASPTSSRHGRPHARAVYWLGLYSADTPGTDVLDNTTHVLGPASEPEPDACLLVRPGHGGQTGLDPKGFVTGPPELVVEVANTSRAIDLGAKKADYEAAGVREYVVALVGDESVVWFRRSRSGFAEIAPGPDGVLRSAEFPGLWLDPKGLFSQTPRPLTAAVRRGLASPEHAAFVAALAARKKAPAEKPRPAVKRPRKPK